jgi:hypothetical protein
MIIDHVGLTVGTTNDIGITWPKDGDPIVVAIYFTQKKTMPKYVMMWLHQQHVLYCMKFLSNHHINLILKAQLNLVLF